MRLLSLLTSIDQPTTIDLDKVRADSRESPVYYVQYAPRPHRVDQPGGGRTRGRPAAARRVDLACSTHDRELDVLRSLSELPDVVVAALRRTGAAQGRRRGFASWPTGSTASTTTAT